MYSWISFVICIPVKPSPSESSRIFLCDASLDIPAPFPCNQWLTVRHYGLFLFPRILYKWSHTECPVWLSLGIIILTWYHESVGHSFLLLSDIPKVKVKVKVAQRPRGLYSPWNSPGQNTRVGSLSLLQGIFPTQGLNPGLPHCRRILYQLSHKGSPRTLEWVAYPFSSGSSRPRNQTGVSCIAGGFFTNWAIREVLKLDFKWQLPENIGKWRPSGWFHILEILIPMDLYKFSYVGPNLAAAL